VRVTKRCLALYLEPPSLQFAIPFRVPPNRGEEAECSGTLDPNPGTKHKKKKRRARGKDGGNLASKEKVTYDTGLAKEGGNQRQSRPKYRKQEASRLKVKEKLAWQKFQHPQSTHTVKIPFSVHER